MRDECEHGSLRRKCDICGLQEEIESLRAENERLRDAASPCAKWMQRWLDEDLCECEGAHYCGRVERAAELDALNKALKGETE